MPCGTHVDVSDLTLRTVTDDDDFQTFQSAVYSAFLEEPQQDEIESVRKLTDYERIFGFHDGKRWVATAGDFAKNVILPGGASVPVAAVTLVSVAAGHRRRGLLTAMMRHQLERIRSRGTEAVAMLFASEASIYGRFGYGLSSFNVELSGQVRELAFRPGVELGDGAVTETDAETLLATAPAIYDAAVAGLPGRMDRPRPWWEHWIHDGEERRKESGRIRFALHHEPDGTPSAFAVYRPKSQWGATGPDAELHIQEVRATNPRAYARIWRFLLDMDLVRTMKYDGATVDEPLRHLVADPRALRCQVIDGIFTRLVDVPAALVLRRYATELDVVLEVTDEFCAWNTGRYRLRGGPDGAECERTTAPADIAISARELGAVYLGGVSMAALTSAGLVGELTPGAVARTATAFGWVVAPGVPDQF
ncbi:enhanced intracellular survival protein Eis [Mycolicibacterium cosmeticum]|uniref:Enhanced intracellular survival protein Eis n=1 Tax=Mycolicibacterium cosmeticum TaxID=258533 RepID=W9B3C2_MYCCO|nr:enhanced intracellular survival protein Eis [Mycolicibacterium cosmeticum]